jgi:cytochrome c oxidase subunit IV
MTLLSAVLVWLGLMVLLALEYVSAYLPPVSGAVPFIGICMAVIVALTFMRLASSRGLVTIFAMAGVFWMLVMMGLGSMDSFTRHDIPIRIVNDGSAFPLVACRNHRQ